MAYRRRSKRTFNAQVVTANANGATLEGMGFASRLLSTLTITGMTGTTPSYTGKLQGSADGVNWYDIAGGGHTALTASGTNKIDLSEVQGSTVLGIPELVRGVLTVTGTAPSGTVTWTIAGQE